MEKIMKARAENLQIEQEIQEELKKPDPEKTVAMEIINDNSGTDRDDTESGE